MNNEIQRYTIYNCGCCSSAKPDECGAWCYYDDVIQIITQKNRKIEELKRENETLKAGWLKNRVKTEEELKLAQMAAAFAANRRAKI